MVNSKIKRGRKGKEAAKKPEQVQVQGEYQGISSSKEEQEPSQVQHLKVPSPPTSHLPSIKMPRAKLDKASRKGKANSFTPEQEKELVKWFKENQVLYDKDAHFNHANEDRHKKTQLIEDKAKEFPDCTPVKLNTFFRSMRCMFGKLSKKTSGEAAKKMSERDKWILEAFAFLKDHITRQQSRSTGKLAQQKSTSEEGSTEEGSSSEKEEDDDDGDGEVASALAQTPQSDDGAVASTSQAMPDLSTSSPTLSGRSASSSASGVKKGKKKKVPTATLR